MSAIVFLFLFFSLADWVDTGLYGYALLFTVLQIIMELRVVYGEHELSFMSCLYSAVSAIFAVWLSTDVSHAVRNEL